MLSLWWCVRFLSGMSAWLPWHHPVLSCPMALAWYEPWERAAPKMGSLAKCSTYIVRGNSCRRTQVTCQYSALWLNFRISVSWSQPAALFQETEASSVLEQEASFPTPMQMSFLFLYILVVGARPWRQQAWPQFRRHQRVSTFSKPFSKP